MKIMLLICSLLLLNHYSSENKTKIDVLIRPIATDTSKYVILKLNAIPDEIFDKSHKPTDLTINDINKIENVIGAAVKKYNKEANKYFKIKNPSGYYKQFIAVTDANGDKEIWVNCFCEVENFTYWKKSIVSVLDGGTCFFQLKINLTRNRFYDFGVNGVA